MAKIANKTNSKDENISLIKHKWCKISNIFKPIQNVRKIFEYKKAKNF